LYEDLVAGREECTRLLLPSVVAAATDEFDRADAALQILPVPLSTDERESRRQTAADLLRQAREDLRRGQTDSDLVAVQSAADTAREARTEFEQLAPLEESQTLVAEPATAEADIAIKDAEAEMTALQALLADPGIRSLVIEDEEVRQALNLEGRIAEFGGRLESASDHLQVETIRLEAEAAAAHLRRVRKRIPERLAGAVPAPATQPADDVPTEAAKSADATDPDGAQAIRLGHLIAEAEALLEEIDPDATGSDLLATQYARLTSMMTLARSTDASAIAGLNERISASMMAIRLVTSAHSLFVGQPERAIQLLNGERFSQDSVTAHAHLLLASARYSLSRRHPDRTVELLDLAANDALRAFQLDPRLELDTSMFSPGFASFFRKHSSGAAEEFQNR
ncbi:MAG: hypothetical protein WBO54_10895, partial [Thermoanaerobaculia bacterium]